MKVAFSVFLTGLALVHAAPMLNSKEAPEIPPGAPGWAETGAFYAEHPEDHISLVSMYGSGSMRLITMGGTAHLYL